MKKITPEQLQHLFLLLFVFLGGWLRFAPTVLAGEVINDGGMFYSMVQDLRNSQYILPEMVTYNGLDLPFAYPPLSFYVTALLSDLFRLPLIELFRWLPALVSTLSIPVFYLLSKEMLQSSAPAVLATAAFAFLPRTYTWFVMGGGISRAMGQFFLLLTIWSAYRLFSNGGIKNLILTTIFGALVSLSHPGLWLHTVVLCVFLWLILDWKAFKRALTVAFGVTLIAAPWWLTVVLRYGFGPFLSASQTGGASALSWLSLVIPSFAEEQFLTLFTIFGLIGLVIQLIRRQYLLPLFLLIPFLVDPRSASSIAVLPLAMLAGIGLNDHILPGIAAILPPRDGSEDVTPKSADWSELFIAHFPVRGTLSYILIIALISAYAYDQPLARTVVPDSSKEALTWIRVNTPPESSFLLLTGINDPFADPVQEWFPVLAEQTSITTVQGREWSLGRDFLSYLDSVRDLQRCLDADLSCVENWAENQNVSYNYLYIMNTPVSTNDNGFRSHTLLTYSLMNSADYEIVYESLEVVIFANALTTH